jgi:hypothetical protein
MRVLQNAPSVISAGFLNAKRTIAFWMLAAFLVCLASPRSVAGNPDGVPTIDGNLGPCTADFTVVDSTNKPVFEATIHLRIKYGFMSKRDTDLEIGTDSNGRAFMKGLPDKLKKPPMEFTIHSGTGYKTVTSDPATDCHPTFNVTLDK